MRSWFLIAAVLSGTAWAQELPVASEAGDQARNAIVRGDYMAAHKMLEQAIAAAGPNGPDNYTQQMWQQITPMLTGELPVNALARSRPPARADAADIARLRRATARPALAEIVRRARGTSIVILNEAHYSPRDRAFALEVARALRPLGYAYLAAETFSQGEMPGNPPAIARLIADRAVTNDTGFCTQDPVFARFTNEALRLGYQPVAYESTEAQNARGPGIQPREDGEAENLKAFLRTQPGAKLLVHVGYGHNIEAPQDSGKGGRFLFMAGCLKQLTGIDPLTINQTTLSDLNPSMHDAYAVAAGKIGRTDSVLIESDRPLLLGKDPGVDLQIVHPARAYRHGRPTWLASLGGKPVAIPRNLLPTKSERLI